jgi:hypothetical protein
MKPSYKIGERVYATEKCKSTILKHANELYYAGRIRNGDHIVEVGNGIIVNHVSDEWIRKAQTVTYYINVYRGKYNTLAYGLPCRTPEEATKKIWGEGWKHLKTVTIELEE